MEVLLADMPDDVLGKIFKEIVNEYYWRIEEFTRHSHKTPYPRINPTEIVDKFHKYGYKSKSLSFALIRTGFNDGCKGLTEEDIDNLMIGRSHSYDIAEKMDIDVNTLNPLEVMADEKKAKIEKMMQCCDVMDELLDRMEERVQKGDK